MTLDGGTLLGHYEITALIGRGGMGEVYKARDTRLGRFVAIKVILPALAERADVQRRFEDECRVTATLDHPRICAVHDVGRQSGLLYLVMELLEGESLDAKTARGPLPRPELLGYAIEIADAVHHAHRHGVIHRDLKPANVFITASGVKVLDFGLAKLRQADSPPTSDVAGEHTAPARTREGAMLGTTLYLPPERLEGKPADERSDVFGFGTILYEMAAGLRAFDGPSPAAVIAAILKTDPPPLPPGRATMDLDWIVRRCLCKNPGDRWQSLGDVSATLKWIARTTGRPAVEPASASIREKAPLIVIASLLVIALAAAWFLAANRARAADATNATVAFTILPPPGGAFTPTASSVGSAQLAVSPDGRDLAFVASGPNRVSQIWIRPLDSPEATPLAGTEGGAYPFWSPDGRKLGFFAKQQLRRIDRRGGPARVLARAPNGRGGTWNRDGVILFSADTTGPLQRVSDNATGLTQQPTFADNDPQTLHRWPQFLPDGRHFIWLVKRNDPETDGVYLGMLGTSASTLLVPSPSGAQYAPPGSLLYVSDGTLVSASLDVATRRLSGDPTPLAMHVSTSTNFYAAFSVSTNGVLAYAGGEAAPEELVWIGRTGERLGSAASHSRYVDFRLSPDARYLALATVDAHTLTPDISVRDLLRGTTIRLTTSPSTDASPVWAPDGSRLMFRSNRSTNVHDLYTRFASGAGVDTVFLKTARAKYPTDWSRSGLVVYQSNDAETGWNLYTVPWSRPGEARAVADGHYDEVQGQLSPDERWLAYTSDESGAPEVYLMSLRMGGRKKAASSHGPEEAEEHGASDPRWRADGRELYYVTSDGALVALPVLLSENDVDFGKPQKLFRMAHAPFEAPYTSEYNPAPNGSRFLVRTGGLDARQQPLTVIYNWPGR